MLIWMATSCLMLAVAVPLVRWGAVRHDENNAWESVRSYAVGLGSRTGTEIYESIDPCDSSDEAGTVQGIIHGTSESDIVGQLDRLRDTLARDGWALTTSTGPDLRRGDFDGTRFMSGREVWFVTGQSSEPDRRYYYWVQMSTDHCILGMF